MAQAAAHDCSADDGGGAVGGIGAERREVEFEPLDDAVALARHALHGIEKVGGADARVLIEAALLDERKPVRSNAQRMLDCM